MPKREQRRAIPPLPLTGGPADTSHQPLLSICHLLCAFYVMSLPHHTLNEAGASKATCPPSHKTVSGQSGLRAGSPICPEPDVLTRLKSASSSQGANPLQTLTPACCLHLPHWVQVSQQDAGLSFQLYPSDASQAPISTHRLLLGWLGEQGTWVTFP